MKKKNIIIISVIMIIILVIIAFVIYGNSRKEINELASLTVLDNSEPRNFYELTVEKDGKYKLTTRKALQGDSTILTDVSYNDKLNELELANFEKIINYLKKEKKIEENVKYTYNYAKDEINYDTNLLGILENTVIALEYISMGDIEIEGTSRRVFGDNMLDNIVTTQLIEK